MKIFGPVPSRRLGRSLGINNIPPKICTLSCVYCQLGRSLKMISERQEFFTPEELIRETRVKIEESRVKNEKIDYLTVVPDGEPTLDIHLGKLLDGLNTTGIKTAVITNSTLIDRVDVRADLLKSSWVSVKVDAASESLWRKIDRPLKPLDYDKIKDGLLLFSREFKGTLATETMLVKGLNDSAEDLRKTASFIALLKPSIAYISIPTRPPAETWAIPPDESVINEAFHIFSETGLPCEYLIGYEGDAFAHTGDLAEDILSITSVHPMREEAVKKMVDTSDGSFEVIEDLIDKEELIRTSFNNHTFYLRKLKRSTPK
ncbi:MAG TPA: radical SAM protein [Candidatus Mcinerneyibacteriales bacterium]|nr:radical SAM protein [Candidatus Mcinerneyibacteriales bacterium]HPJ69347.1 radical SAM protein [Candidatus Mcinerneyibacteriales bacterium]